MPNQQIQPGNQPVSDQFLTDTGLDVISETSFATQTGKPYFSETPGQEQIGASIAFREAVDIWSQKESLPDPCGNKELAVINNSLHRFFNELKRLKEYGEVFLVGGLNKAKKLTQLIRSTGKIIAAVLKKLVQKMRNYILKKIRAGIQDILDKLLPTVAKSIKNTIFQKIIDTILCKFKDLLKNIFNLVVDFLFELVGKVVNIPLCAAEQFTNSLINGIAAELDRQLAPLMDQLSSSLGKFGEKLSGVFEALDYILGFESFLCEKPNCPQQDEFILGPWGEGVENFKNQFSKFKIPSDSEAISDILEWTDDFEIFGTKLGDVDDPQFATSSSITRCNTEPFRCGPPTLEFFGGGGLGAAGDVVVDRFGKILGVDLKFGGGGYKTPPFVTILDPCDNGNFASAYAKIDNGVVTEVIITNSGGGYLNAPGNSEFDNDPEDDNDLEDDNDDSLSIGNRTRDYVVCLYGFKVISTGIGYNLNDFIVSNSTEFEQLQGLEVTIKMTENGQILSVELGDTVCGLTSVPDFDINSDTGDGAIIEPILKIFDVEDIREDIDNIPNILISSSGDILDSNTRQVIIKSDLVDELISIDSEEIELTDRTNSGQRNLVRVIDCVR